MKAFLACVITALICLGTGSAYATTRDESRANDHVLIGTDHDFEEWFKRDSGKKGFAQGHNNYIFTSSAVVDAPPPGKCTVVTGDSEKTIAMFCNTNPK